MHSDEPISNASSNPHLDQIVAQGEGRRAFLKRTAAAAVILGSPMVMRAPWGAAVAAPPTTASVGIIGFAGLSITTADTVTVPAGYTAKALYNWGDPISAGPSLKPDVSDSSADQLLQSGMHHDGIHFFPFVERKRWFGLSGLSSTHGLLVMNHEYTDDGLLFPDARATWTAEKVRKVQAAHGVSVIEVEKAASGWRVLRPSSYARRITAFTPMSFSGPAAGDVLLRTAADPTGTTVQGTANNCGNGYTPWGTYLACEENFNGYFATPGTPSLTADQRRYGISAAGFGYRWHEFDIRFDFVATPNEPNRFGWIVEIDPWNPDSVPVKRTALGRVKHEGATVTLAADGRAVVYTGDDERFEYIYKFVTKGIYNPVDMAANRALLDDGTLYVAQFYADGTGAWIPLVAGQGPLVAANGFASQADVCIRTRQAADAVGATKMDRPEWIAVHPVNKDVYVTLTNNSQRGTSGRPAADAANPRASNVFGHILRWAENGGDSAAAAFTWNIFAQCGDPALGDPNKAGNLNGVVFGSPDGAFFDPRGVLWIQTDISTSVLGTGDYKNIGNNQMIAFNPATGEGRRFLVGPRGCEITGIVATPDLETLFINVQHPGETASELSDPANPKAISSWPDGPSGTRPRSGTVVITKDDGGAIGT